MAWAQTESLCLVDVEEGGLGSHPPGQSFPVDQVHSRLSPPAGGRKAPSPPAPEYTDAVRAVVVGTRVESACSLQCRVHAGLSRNSLENAWHLFFSLFFFFN